MPDLIAFSGLPGVGKSSIARALARRIAAVYLRVDSIETALRRSVLRIHPAEDAGYLALAAVAKDNLEQGLDVIADTVNPLALTRRLWAETASAAGARLVDVEVLCSDQDEHRRRVEERHRRCGAPETPNWETVRRRRYEPWTEPRITVDSFAMSIAECVAAIAEARKR